MTAGRGTCATALLLALLWTGCGGDRAPATPTGDPTPEGAEPRDVDVEALPANDVPALVLRECHDGIVGMDRFAARVMLPDGGVVRAYGHMPDRLRAQWPDGRVQVLDGSRTSAVVDGVAGAELEADAAVRLRALRALLDVATLGPVHRSIGCTRTGPRSFSLAQPATTPWELVLRPRSLLVESLATADTRVEVLDHLRTTTTWIVSEVNVEPLGSCRVRFDSIDFDWDESMFSATAQDAAADADRSDRTDVIRIGAPRQSPVPRIEEVRALRWLVVEDPVDWTARAEAVQRHLATLKENGQTMAGFPGLLHEAEVTRLVIPFRPAADAGPFAAPSSWDVRDVPAGRALVVFPPDGDVSRRWSEGERALQRALDARGLVAAGPVLAQPYLHLDEAAPSPDEVEAPVVRVSVALR